MLDRDAAKIFCRQTGSAERKVCLVPRVKALQPQQVVTPSRQERHNAFGMCAHGNYWLSFLRETYVSCLGSKICQTRQRLSKKIKFVLQISVENNDYNKSLFLITTVTCFTFSILNTFIDIQFNKHYTR